MFKADFKELHSVVSSAYLVFTKALVTLPRSLLSGAMVFLAKAQLSVSDGKRTKKIMKNWCYSWAVDSEAINQCCFFLSCLRLEILVKIQSLFLPL